MDKTDVLFPSSFRGYSRRAVNDFILKMNGDLSARIEEAERRSDRLAADLERREDDIAALRGQITMYREKLAERENEAMSLSGDVKTLSEECKQIGNENSALKEERQGLLSKIDELSAAVDEKERSIAELDDTLVGVREENRSLTETLTVLDEENAALREKIREMSRDIEDLAAEKDRITAKIPEAVEEKLNGVSGKMSSILREHVKKCLREVMSGIDAMRQEADALSIDAKSRADRMTSSIDAFEDEMKDEVRTILNEMRSED